MSESYVDISITISESLYDAIIDYNKTQHGPGGTKINITYSCIQALQSELLTKRNKLDNVNI